MLSFHLNCILIVCSFKPMSSLLLCWVSSLDVDGDGVHGAGDVLHICYQHLFIGLLQSWTATGNCFFHSNQGCALVNSMFIVFTGLIYDLSYCGWPQNDEGHFRGQALRARDSGTVTNNYWGTAQLLQGLKHRKQISKSNCFICNGQRLHHGLKVK